MSWDMVFCPMVGYCLGDENSLTIGLDVEMESVLHGIVSYGRLCLTIELNVEMETFFRFLTIVFLTSSPFAIFVVIASLDTR